MDNKGLLKEHKAVKSELQASLNELAFYSGIRDTLSRTSDLKKLISSIMMKAKGIAGASAWSLLLLDEPFLKKLALKTSANIRKLSARKGKGIIYHVLEKGVSVSVPDIKRERLFNKKTDGLRDMQIRSLLCVPLKLTSRCIGVLSLINKRKDAGFTDRDIELLQNTAYFIGMAVERTFLFRRMEEISVTDDLTDLYNFRHLHQTVDMEVERANRYGSNFSIIFMDIDNFKEVNDRNDHLTGSKVLIEMARLLKDNLRKVDIVTRYGGDEFVIILPQTPGAGCFLVADRLRRIIEKYVFLKNSATPIRLTASFGIASYPGKAKNKESLLRMADHAMYRGKFSTKNIVFEAK